MKIIGHVGDGKYIVEMTEGEICMAGGYRHRWDVPGFNDQRAAPFPIGGNFDVRTPWIFISDIQSKQNQAEQAATLLRAIADLITKGLPSNVFTPPEQPAQEPKA